MLENSYSGSIVDHHMSILNHPYWIYSNGMKEPCCGNPEIGLNQRNSAELDFSDADCRPPKQKLPSTLNDLSYVNLEKDMSSNKEFICGSLPVASTSSKTSKSPRQRLEALINKVLFHIPDQDSPDLVVFQQLMCRRNARTILQWLYRHRQNDFTLFLILASHKDVPFLSTIVPRLLDAISDAEASLVRKRKQVLRAMATDQEKPAGYSGTELDDGNHRPVEGTSQSGNFLAALRRPHDAGSCHNNSDGDTVQSSLKLTSPGYSNEQSKVNPDYALEACSNYDSQGFQFEEVNSTRGYRPHQFVHIHDKLSSTGVKDDHDNVLDNSGDTHGNSSLEDFVNVKTLKYNNKWHTPYVSIRLPKAPPRGIFADWSYLVFRRIQDKVGFCQDQLFQLQCQLLDTELPLTSPLTQLDIDQSGMTNLFQSTVLKELLGHQLMPVSGYSRPKFQVYEHSPCLVMRHDNLSTDEDAPLDGVSPSCDYLASQPSSVPISGAVGASQVQDYKSPLPDSILPDSQLYGECSKHRNIVPEIDPENDGAGCAPQNPKLNHVIRSLSPGELPSSDCSRIGDEDVNLPSFEEVTIPSAGPFYGGNDATVSSPGENVKETCRWNEEPTNSKNKVLPRGGENQNGCELNHDVTTVRCSVDEKVRGRRGTKRKLVNSHVERFREHSGSRLCGSRQDKNDLMPSSMSVRRRYAGTEINLPIGHSPYSIHSSRVPSQKDPRKQTRSECKHRDGEVSSQQMTSSSAVTTSLGRKDELISAVLSFSSLQNANHTKCIHTHRLFTALSELDNRKNVLEWIAKHEEDTLRLIASYMKQQHHSDLGEIKVLWTLGKKIQLISTGLKDGSVSGTNFRRKNTKLMVNVSNKKNDHGSDKLCSAESVLEADSVPTISRDSKSFKHSPLLLGRFRQFQQHYDAQKQGLSMEDRLLNAIRSCKCECTISCDMSHDDLTQIKTCRIMMSGSLAGIGTGFTLQSAILNSLTRFFGLANVQLFVRLYGPFRFVANLEGHGLSVWNAVRDTFKENIFKISALRKFNKEKKKTVEHPMVLDLTSAVTYELWRLQSIINFKWQVNQGTVAVDLWINFGSDGPAYIGSHFTFIGAFMAIFTRMYGLELSKDLLTLLQRRFPDSSQTLHWVGMNCNLCYLTNLFTDPDNNISFGGEKAEGVKRFLSLSETTLSLIAAGPKKGFLLVAGFLLPEEEVTLSTFHKKLTLYESMSKQLMVMVTTLQDLQKIGARRTLQHANLEQLASWIDAENSGLLSLLRIMALAVSEPKLSFLTLSPSALCIDANFSVFRGFWRHISVPDQTDF